MSNVNLDGYVSAGPSIIGTGGGVISGGTGATIGPGSVYGPMGNTTGWIDESAKLATIQGEMITAELVFKDIEIESMKEKHGNEGFKYEIKKKLVEIMVEKAFLANKFDFGMQQNYTDFTYTFRARMFVTPDNHTRIIKNSLDK